MTQTENDYFEITQKILNTQRDFRAPFSRYPSHKIHYNPHGLPWSNLESQSFVVDWQMTVVENSNNDKLWY